MAEPSSTMIAARFYEPGKPLEVEQVPVPGHWGLADPTRTGGVLAGPQQPDARPAALRARPHRPHLVGPPHRPVDHTAARAAGRDGKR